MTRMKLRGIFAQSVDTATRFDDNRGLRSKSEEFCKIYGIRK